MQPPPLDPDVADTAPSSSVLTPYDQEHIVTYLRLLDADAEGADPSGFRSLREAVVYLGRNRPHGRSSRMKLAKDMSTAERQAALDTIKRGPPPVPVESTKRATEMSDLERQEYLREHKKRFGI